MSALSSPPKIAAPPMEVQQELAKLAQSILKPRLSAQPQSRLLVKRNSVQLLPNNKLVDTSVYHKLGTDRKQPYESYYVHTSPGIFKVRKHS
jgi:hypothetical protein